MYAYWLFRLLTSGEILRIVKKRPLAAGKKSQERPYGLGVEFFKKRVSEKCWLWKSLGICRSKLVLDPIFGHFWPFLSFLTFSLFFIDFGSNFGRFWIEFWVIFGPILGQILIKIGVWVTRWPPGGVKNETKNRSDDRYVDLMIERRRSDDRDVDPGVEKWSKKSILGSNWWQKIDPMIDMSIRWSRCRSDDRDVDPGVEKSRPGGRKLIKKGGSGDPPRRTPRGGQKSSKFGQKKGSGDPFWGGDPPWRGGTPPWDRISVFADSGERADFPRGFSWRK